MGAQRSVLVLVCLLASGCGEEDEGVDVPDLVYSWSSAEGERTVSILGGKEYELSGEQSSVSPDWRYLELRDPSFQSTITTIKGSNAWEAGGSPIWSPDGARVVLDELDELDEHEFRVCRSNGTECWAREGSLVSGWSPDSAWLAFVRVTGGGDVTSLHVVDRHGTEEFQVFGGPAPIDRAADRSSTLPYGGGVGAAHAAWTPDSGGLLMVIDGVWRLWLIERGLVSVEAFSAEAHPILAQAKFSAVSNQATLRSPDGVVVVDLETFAKVSIRGGSPSWSPVAARLLYSRVGPEPGVSELAVWDADKGTSTPVAQGGAVSGDWNPTVPGEVLVEKEVNEAPRSFTSEHRDGCTANRADAGRG